MLVPYRKFTIETKYDIAKIMHLLSHSVQISKQFISNPLSRERKIFLGKIDTDGFRIVRNVSYLNSFLPVIKGVFEKGQYGLKINVSMSLNPLALIAIISIFGFFSFFFMTLQPINKNSKNLLVLATICGGGLGYLFCYLMFVLNVKFDKNYLIEIFKN